VTGALGDERAHRLNRLLIDAGRAICRIDALLGHWSAAAPELVNTIDQTTALREAIDVLAVAGAVTVPRGRTYWDPSFTPALPLFVVVAGVSRARREQAWRDQPWRHELGWVASLRTITDGNLASLLAINDWLVSTKGGKVPAVPQRIRSAEVLGDEKGFDALSKTSLFGPGKLSWGLLGAIQVEPPLALRRVGPGGAVLVVENADPYWLAVDALRAGSGPVGLVAWGQGRAGMRSLPTLAHEPDVTGPVWYWGDLDPVGLDIPTDASPAVEATGLGPLVPAVALYEAMADHADRAGGTECRSAWTGRDRSRWLGDRMWARFGRVVESGHRVAQEVLGPEQVVTATQRLGLLAGPADGAPISPS
jgi:hypothetical protein